MSSENDFQAIFSKCVGAGKSLKDTEKLYQGWAHNYEKDMKQRKHWNAPAISAQYLDKACIRLGLEKNINILDVASGTGLVGEELGKIGYKHIDALDISEDMHVEARKKNVYTNFITATMGSEPTHLESDQYDAVVSAGCFLPGHMTEESFPELIRLVKPSGLIVFSLKENMYVDEDPDFPLNFEPFMVKLAIENQWKILGREVVPNYIGNQNGLVFTLRKVSRERSNTASSTNSTSSNS